MLTVKHIHPSGCEYIYQTDEAAFMAPGVQSLGPSVWFEEAPSARKHVIELGLIYVMNASGSTVAKYDLGGMYPLSSDGPTAPPPDDLPLAA